MTLEDLARDLEAHVVTTTQNSMEVQQFIRRLREAVFWAKEAGAE